MKALIFQEISVRSSEASGRHMHPTHMGGHICTALEVRSRLLTRLRRYRLTLRRYRWRPGAFTLCLGILLRLLRSRASRSPLLSLSICRVPPRRTSHVHVTTRPVHTPDTGHRARCARATRERSVSQRDVSLLSACFPATSLKSYFIHTPSCLSVPSHGAYICRWAKCYCPIPRSPGAA